ncbi:hypothetical protein FVF58_06175 [Paraburkholderia panacisoli]|uniref:Uncharacterized protein n=1 Tax=Paraburkholderia panacisoli TaxID=2603818 RepID=A0A5B0HHG0_9BURK|nr:hypothetical protein [Paraburkholderia panacisoli]KAA1014434.1 hypothetical protein FVF58_06175 [Paraburkholderia panacisoli]
MLLQSTTKSYVLSMREKRSVHGTRRGIHNISFGKTFGRKDHYALLSPVLLERLRVFAGIEGSVAVQVSVNPTKVGKAVFFVEDLPASPAH